VVGDLGYQSPPAGAPAGPVADRFRIQWPLLQSSLTQSERGVVRLRRRLHPPPWPHPDHGEGDVKAKQRQDGNTEDGANDA
jgi:hypothetical protein